MTRIASTLQVHPLVYVWINIQEKDDEASNITHSAKMGKRFLPWDYLENYRCSNRFNLACDKWSSYKHLLDIT
ncbi:hypothetical protein GOP47_0010664 [Adiantum capillus-veneris]|uniref:Uncharacterized protein n=1 Tax=Adiantum capillus-veneris TaxID=13818 RepID=A0A9D4UW98_ADICA|nr:hypothetical protein GOP47_0010664 [Adiantum capillus-veneris]